MSPVKRHHFYLGIRRWHRRVGLVAAVFAILLAVTGLLLNHTEDLQLDSSFIHSAALLNWYGISAPAHPVAYTAGGHWISRLGERLYFDNKEVSHDQGQLIGAVGIADRVIVAVEGQVLLFTAAGELLETLGGTEGVPAGMRAVGAKDGNLVVRASHGDYVTDKDLLLWEESEEGGARKAVAAEWAKPAPLPKTLYRQLAEEYRGKGLSIERVVLDLHSGRMFGSFWIWFTDFIGILIVLLAISGLWMWLRVSKRAF